MCSIVVDKRFLVQFSFASHQLIAINPQLNSTSLLGIQNILMKVLPAEVVLYANNITFI